MVFEREARVEFSLRFIFTLFFFLEREKVSKATTYDSRPRETLTDGPDKMKTFQQLSCYITFQITLRLGDTRHRLTIIPTHHSSKSSTCGTTHLSFDIVPVYTYLCLVVIRDMSVISYALEHKTYSTGQNVIIIITSTCGFPRRCGSDVLKDSTHDSQTKIELIRYGMCLSTRAMTKQR